MLGCRVSLFAPLFSPVRAMQCGRNLYASAQHMEKHILQNHVKQIQLSHATIPEMVWQNVDCWPNHTAVVCSETGRSYTYRELQRRSVNLARSLTTKLGFKKGTTMAILLPNVPEYPIALLGSMEAGMITTTVNPMYTMSEIARQLQDSDSRAIVTVPELYDIAREAACTLRKDVLIITVKTKPNSSTSAGSIDFTELCTSDVGRKPFAGYTSISTDDVAVLPYSSGTTGLPKGVELTHRNIIANLCQVAIVDGEIVRETTASVQDVVPCFLPMYHIYGMTGNTLKLLSLGVKLITVPQFSPEGFIDMMARYRPDHLFLVPPIVVFLAAHPLISRQRHLDSLRTIFSGAAPLAATDIERLWLKAEREIPALQGFGMTETSPGITLTPPDRWRECLGSVGVCLPATECRVVSVDDNETNLGPGQSGELLIRGPQVMRGYRNNRQATEQVLDSHGWLRTGDLGHYDTNEVVWITDRLKELIKVKGYQVAPAELEAVVRNHPLVADVAVIGIPHPMLGEAPKAFIVPKPNAKLSPEQVQQYVAEHVASYKKLEGGVTFVDSIPKNPAGKIMRKSLR